MRLKYKIHKNVAVASTSLKGRFLKIKNNIYFKKLFVVFQKYDSLLPIHMEDRKYSYNIAQQLDNLKDLNQHILANST